MAVLSRCVEVPVADAEDARRALLAANLLRKDLQIVRAGDRVYIPVAAEFRGAYPQTEREFREAFMPVRRWQELAQVPSRLRPLLPASLDVIGDIAILRLPEELRAFEGEIGRAILSWNRKLRSVAADEGVGGEYRVRQLRAVAGAPSLETVHLEYGLRYAVDVGKAYFSPRLGTERMRVANQVQPGETVADLFAGVGPYSILIARRRNPRVVHAVDSNEDALRYLRTNIRANRAWSTEPHLADARAALAKLGSVDRIIMDLPHTGREFLEDALRAVRPGGMVHYYAILTSAEAADHRGEIVDLSRQLRRHVAFAAVHEVRGFSPAKKHWAYDLRVT